MIKKYNSKFEVMQKKTGNAVGATDLLDTNQFCNLKAMQEKIDARGSRWEISRKELH